MTLLFETSRLKVQEVTNSIASSELEELLVRVPEILTPAVVENLPPYFHGINTQADAKIWFDRMIAESRLFVIHSASDKSLIGFIFVFVENERDAHIGYLFAKSYWGKGLASELLTAFVAQVSRTQSWDKLIGGVEHSNIASIKVLEKLGFIRQSDAEGDESGAESDVIFYHYMLRQ